MWGRHEREQRVSAGQQMHVHDMVDKIERLIARGRSAVRQLPWHPGRAGRPVLLLLCGFVVLHRVVAGGSPRIADQLALIATIMSAATLTVQQAVDGVARKHAVDAWAAATGPEQIARFGDAETVRWLEWGINSFFYSLVGLMVGLSGLAIVTRTVVPRWLGWSAVMCGLGLIINAVPVGFRGFAATPEMGVHWLSVGSAEPAQTRTFPRPHRLGFQPCHNHRAGAGVTGCTT
jgi:hypothetical protein